MNPIKIERRSKDNIRNSIAQILKESSNNLRGYFSEEIGKAIDILDFSSTYIPDKLFTDDLFREKDFNDFLDYIYINSSILYDDVFNIRDYMVRLNRLFNQTIIPQIKTTADMSSRVRNLIKMKKNTYAFTDIISESFSDNINTYEFDNRLAINPGAGILRLPGIEKDYSNPENINISFNIISGGCKEIDSSEELNVFSNDPLSPYYINSICTGKPVNYSRGNLNFANIQGIIVDLIITFPDIVPINQIAFNQFSDAPMEILQIQSTTMAGQDIHYSGFERISLNKISYDNNEIEINFPFVNTRELHIFINQKRYKQTNEAIKIAKYKKIKDYLNHCKTAMQSIDNKGYTENINIDNQLSELFENIKKETRFPIDDISGNTRSYTIGLYGLKVASILYSAGGIYRSETRRTNGNINNVSFTHDGVNTIYQKGEEDNDNIIATSLFSVDISGNRFYLAEKESGKIKDICELEANIIYENGVPQVKNDYPLRLHTHFLPYIVDNQISNFILHFDDNIITPSNYNLIKDLYSVTVELSNIDVTMNNLSENISVIIEYSSAVVDLFNNKYDPSYIDLIDRLGKPNIVNHRVLPVSNSYLYVLDGNRAIGYMEEEYTEVLLEGKLYYGIGPGKGENTVELISRTDDEITYYYVDSDYCIEPVDRNYSLIYMENIEDNKTVVTKNNIEYFRYKAENPYCKGTIHIYLDDIPLTEGDYIEYDNDTSVVVPKEDDDIAIEDKKSFYIKKEIIDNNKINISYAPIVKDYTELEIISNIAQHNVNENYTKITEEGIKLGRYPYIDIDIINSPSFTHTEGIFSYSHMFSIIYEPIEVHVNGVKAINITRYRTSDPAIETKILNASRNNQIMYYINEDGVLIPSTELLGNINVKYYSMSDSLRMGIEMSKSSYYRQDVTPEIHDYSILLNVKR